MSQDNNIHNGIVNALRDPVSGHDLLKLVFHILQPQGMNKQGMVLIIGAMRRAVADLSLQHIVCGALITTNNWIRQTAFLRFFNVVLSDSCYSGELQKFPKFLLLLKHAFEIDVATCATEEEHQILMRKYPKGEGHKNLLKKRELHSAIGVLLEQVKNKNIGVVIRSNIFHTFINSTEQLSVSQAHKSIDDVMQALFVECSCSVQLLKHMRETPRFDLMPKHTQTILSELQKTPENFSQFLSENGWKAEQMKRRKHYQKVFKRGICHWCHKHLRSKWKTCQRCLSVTYCSKKMRRESVQEAQESLRAV